MNAVETRDWIVWLAHLRGKLPAEDYQKVVQLAAERDALERKVELLEEVIMKMEALNGY